MRQTVDPVDCEGKGREEGRAGKEEKNPQKTLLACV